jgi:hypothetical protein
MFFRNAGSSQLAGLYELIATGLYQTFAASAQGAYIPRFFTPNLKAW